MNVHNGRVFLRKPFKNYMSYNPHPAIPVATDHMIDEEIISIAELTCKEQSINYYAIMKYPLMKNLSFDLEKIKNPLNSCGLELKGLTTGYTFIGCKGSESEIHSEDYQLPSINMNFEGIKVCYFVEFLCKTFDEFIHSSHLYLVLHKRLE